MMTFPAVGERLPEGEGAVPLGHVLQADSAAVPGVTGIAREMERWKRVLGGGRAGS